MRRLWLVQGLVLIGCHWVVLAGAPQETPQTYEFNDADVQLIATKIGESLITFERPGLEHAKVAWLRLRNDTEERKLPMRELMEAIEVTLVKAQRYQVLRRTELDVIATENGLSLTALVDPAVTARLGRLAGVDYWLSATITGRTNREAGKEFVYYNFTAFLTDARSTERVWGETAELKKARRLQLVEKRIKG